MACQTLQYFILSICVLPKFSFLLYNFLFVFYNFLLNSMLFLLHCIIFICILRFCRSFSLHKFLSISMVKYFFWFVSKDFISYCYPLSKWVILRCLKFAVSCLTGYYAIFGKQIECLYNLSALLPAGVVTTAENF